MILISICCKCPVYKYHQFSLLSVLLRYKATVVEFNSDVIISLKFDMDTDTVFSEITDCRTSHVSGFWTCCFWQPSLTVCAVDLFRVKKSLTETKPDDVDLFTKNVQTFIKDVLANYKEYQLFCGTCRSAVIISWNTHHRFCLTGCAKKYDPFASCNLLCFSLSYIFLPYLLFLIFSFENSARLDVVAGDLTWVIICLGLFYVVVFLCLMICIF